MIPKDIKINTIIEYSIILLVIVDTSTMWRFVTTSPIYGYSFGVLISALCIVDILLYRRFLIDKRAVARFVLVVSLLLVYVLATRYNTMGTMTGLIAPFIIYFILAVVLYSNERMARFLNIYSNVMLTIAAVSLVFFIFGTVLDLLPGRTAVTYHWANRYSTSFTYFYLYFENPIQIAEHGLCNLGVFAEAPGFAGYLIFGLLIELSRLKDAVLGGSPSRMIIGRSLLYAATILSSASSKGVIAVLIIALAILFARPNKSTTEIAVKVTVGLVLSVVVIDGIVFITQTKLATGSGFVRMDHLNAALQAWFGSPIFGVGYSNNEAVWGYTTLSGSLNGLSMGMAVLMAYGGLWLLGIYLGSIISARCNPYFRNKKDLWALVVVILLFNLFVSNMAFTDAYIFMIAAAYASPSLPDKTEGVVCVQEPLAKLGTGKETLFPAV